MLVDATPLPVSADLEKGFADTPDGVAETVTLAGEIGLAGCSIEDHTGDRADPIFDQGLAVERVAAAVEAAHAISPDFILTARCESFLWGGTDLDAVIRRLQAFEAVGADVLYAPGLTDLDSIRTLCQSVTRPVNVVMGMPGATFDLDALKQAGVARAILSNGSPDMLAAAVTSAGIADLLDDVLSVEAVGRFKPHPSVYDLVGARFSTRPDQVLFVSSNGWDIAGAAAYGFDTIWIAEHLFSTYGVVTSTQVLAAAIARATKTIRIGMSVVVLPFTP